MATTTLRRRTRPTGLVSVVGASRCRAGGQAPLSVEGRLPEDLDGCFLQARPHPTGGAVPFVEGIRLRGGVATRFRGVEDGSRHCPFGPVPPGGAHASGLVGRPVADAVEPVWHTVVTGEHVVLDGAGRVLRTRPLPVAGGPAVQALAVAGRHVVVFDLPVAHCRAAGLVGERDPYVWHPDRPARIGLLPRCPERSAGPAWFTVEQGCAAAVAGAHHRRGEVVVDVLWHRRSGRAPADLAARPAPVVRWTLDQETGVATRRQLTGPVLRAVSEGDCLVTVSDTAGGAEVVRHDPATGGEDRWALGPGLVAGQPVLLPTGRAARWLMLPVERVATRTQDLLVFDRAGVAAGPVASVSVPAGPRPSARAMWLDLGGRATAAASV